MTRKLTLWGLIAFVAILIVYDIAIYITPPSGDTISEVVLGLARQHPVIPFLLGVLGGHLCWPQWIAAK